MNICNEILCWISIMNILISRFGIRVLHKDLSEYREWITWMNPEWISWVKTLNEFFEWMSVMKFYLWHFQALFHPPAVLLLSPASAHQLTNLAYSHYLANSPLTVSRSYSIKCPPYSTDLHSLCRVHLAQLLIKIPSKHKRLKHSPK